MSARRESPRQITMFPGPACGVPNGTDPGGKFIIVQSRARIPIDHVREYCLSFAG